MTSIKERLSLRNKVHKDDFRFNFSPSLWSSHYLSENEIEVGHLVEVRENGELKGYAVLEYSVTNRNKACVVREMCADPKEAFQQLVDRIIEEGVKQNVDFIVWRKCQEPYGDVLQEKGFLTFSESIVMVALLNPEEFLKPFSEKVDCGKIARLNIRGFESVFLKIGKDKFSIEESCSEDFTVSTDGLTFVKLFLGKSSFFKEWLRGKMKVGVLHYRTAKRLFMRLKNERWYMPSGDWC